jgi:hypothetical protein
MATNVLKFTGTIKTNIGAQDPQPFVVTKNMAYTKSTESTFTVAALTGTQTVMLSASDNADVTILTTDQPVTVKLGGEGTGHSVTDFFIWSGTISQIVVSNAQATQANCYVAMYQKLMS